MKIRQGNRLERKEHRKEKEVKEGKKAEERLEIESRQRILHVSIGETRGKQNKRNSAERR